MEYLIDEADIEVLKNLYFKKRHSIDKIVKDFEDKYTYQIIKFQVMRIIKEYNGKFV